MPLLPERQELAETRPSPCIKINVGYRETLASATDSNLTQWMFILNVNLSNKIDQVRMAFISQQGQRASFIEKYKTRLGILSGSRFMMVSPIILISVFG